MKERGKLRFSTALARLNLYEELQKMGEQVLYTDSVIYRWREGQPYIPRGFPGTKDRRTGRRSCCGVWISRTEILLL